MFKVHVHITKALVLLTLFCLNACAELPAEPAGWIRSNWGIRFVLPAGDTEWVKKFDVDAVMADVDQLSTISWVMINLTGGANGSAYTGPNALLETIDPGYAPERDLLGEMAGALKARGLKVMVYFDSQGPNGEQFLRKLARERGQARSDFEVAKNEARLAQIQKWKQEVARASTSPEQLTATLIEQYSTRYGALIDGWWFDHGETGFPQQYVTAAKKGNKAAVVAWNEAHNMIRHRAQGRTVKVWGLARSNPYEDFTAGHITPRTTMPYSDPANFAVVRQMQKASTIDGLVPHLFLPVQEYWRGGSTVFEPRQLYDWVRDITAARGGVTLAIGLQPPEFRKSALDKHALQLVKQLDALMAAQVTDR